MHTDAPDHTFVRLYKDAPERKRRTQRSWNLGEENNTDNLKMCAVLSRVLLMSIHDECMPMLDIIFPFMIFLGHILARVFQGWNRWISILTPQIWSVPEGKWSLRAGSSRIFRSKQKLLRFQILRVLILALKIQDDETWIHRFCCLQVQFISFPRRHSSVCLPRWRTFGWSQCSGSLRPRRVCFNVFQQGCIWMHHAARNSQIMSDQSNVKALDCLAVLG